MRKTKIIKTVAVLMGTCISLTMAVTANAETFPDKPIRLVVPFSPGGSTDVLARIYARKLGEQLDQTVIVENKPGAGTVVGADLVAKSPADGYTLLFSGASTFTVNHVLYKSLPYSADKSFSPLGIIASTPLILLANPKAIKANTLKELAAELKGRDDVAYASFGNGSTSHFVGEMFQSALGTRMLHVPYKGSAPAMNDLIGGQVALSVDTVVAAGPQVKGGKVKALAVSGLHRSALLPNVPTATEAGYPDVQYSTWFAIAAPAGIPDDVRKKLTAAIKQSMTDKALRKQFEDNGYEPEYGSPAQFQERVVEEIKRLKTIASNAHISIQ